MRLAVVTPDAVVVEADDVRSIRAEDETGSFGIEPGHTSLLTVLIPSVVTWRDAGGTERYVAVRGGVLRVRPRPGGEVQIATSEAMAGDDLDALRAAVLARYEAEAEAEATARSHSARLHGLAIRAIHRLVSGDGAERLPLGAAGEEEQP